MSVRTERHGHVMTIILDRLRKRNAVDRFMASELLKAFESFEQDSEARVAVLWGAGGHFCAGLDLGELGTEAESRLTDVANGPMGPTRLQLTKPTIAAVAGYAVAGGFELALLCDLRVIEEDSVFGVFNRRWGIPLIDGGTVRLPQIVGLGRALDLILTGRPIEADEARKIGLAHSVVPHGEARTAAEQLARTIADFPPQALRSDRLSCYEAIGRRLPEALANELRLGRQPLESGESRAGAARFRAGEGRHGRF